MAQARVLKSFPRPYYPLIHLDLQSLPSLKTLTSTFLGYGLILFAWLLQELYCQCQIICPWLKFPSKSEKAWPSSVMNFGLSPNTLHGLVPTCGMNLLYTGFFKTENPLSFLVVSSQAGFSCALHPCQASAPAEGSCLAYQGTVSRVRVL